MIANRIDLRASTLSAHDARTTGHRRASAFRGAGVVLSVLSLTGALAGCSAEVGRGSAPSAGNPAAPVELTATVGPSGGELTGAKGTAFEGVHVVIPAGALASDTAIHVTLADDATPLPATAVACGKTFAIEPAGIVLGAPATVTLPFDEAIVTDNERFDDEVKVWLRDGDHWSQTKQTDSEEGLVTIALPTLTRVAAGVNPPQPVDVVHFDLAPNPKLVRCLAEYPDDPTRQPKAQVTVVRGELNDSLWLKGEYIKPGLNFDMFTVENSPLDAKGAPDPSFTNFGLAWYQSDLASRSDGRARVNIRTILLDQIFGFDPKASLPPTGTFHVGFWFNDPNDAAACGFDASKPTPFNGDHKAGPLAMISLPSAATNLGPLCTKPDTSTTPAKCSP